jgi:predicted ABC-class ATPase
MAIPAGITTIIGGGFHGKSTLLQAISLGVWNHIPGDGREFVVTNPSAVGVRSEDGRSVSSVDISAFIGNLPGGTTTERWSSDDASGSTSMAAAVIEVKILLRC